MFTKGFNNGFSICRKLDGYGIYMILSLRKPKIFRGECGVETITLALLRIRDAYIGWPFMVGHPGRTAINGFSINVHPRTNRAAVTLYRVSNVTGGVRSDVQQVVASLTHNFQQPTH